MPRLLVFAAVLGCSGEPPVEPNSPQAMAECARTIGHVCFPSCQAVFDDMLKRHNTERPPLSAAPRVGRCRKGLGNCDASCTQHFAINGFGSQKWSPGQGVPNSACQSQTCEDGTTCYVALNARGAGVLAREECTLASGCACCPNGIGSAPGQCSNTECIECRCAYPAPEDDCP